MRNLNILDTGRKMRAKLLALGGLGVVLAVIGTTMMGGASAAPCQPTGFSGLTAQEINPAAVTGTVDASGCDVGVYYDDGGAHTVSNATVQDANQYGILVRQATTVTVDNDSTVQRIGNHTGGQYDPNGVQTGVGISYREGSTGSVDDSLVHEYQKNGFVIRDTGTNVSVTNSTVQGEGPVNYIAQNGIQYSEGAAGLVRNNVIRDHDYTPKSYVAIGMLLYDIEPKNIKRSLNTYRENEMNEVVYTSASIKE
jgi:hypothetical protein